MLIVVEGPDCAGKTTLVHRIAEQLSARRDHVELRHCSQLKNHPLIEYERTLDDYVPGSGHHIIYDRLHLGELVYGPLKRGGSQLTREQWLHIELSLAQQGALLALVDADDDTLLARHNKRGETFVSPSELLVVADYYRKLQRRHAPVTQFNAVRGSASALPSLLITLAEILEDYAVHVSDHTTLIGAPPGELTKPHILLLGDRRGPGQNEHEHTRAFVPYVSTSGAYLMQTIDRFAWLGHTCIANAWEEDLVKLWSVLGEPHVVALGREADKVATMMEIPHGTVPHPQFVRRFMHDQAEQYCFAILEAAKTKKEIMTWPS